MSAIIGKGGFAVVHKGKRRKDGADVAIKVIDTANASKELMRMMRSEIDILMELDQQNIVKFVAFYERLPKLLIVMELMSGGELFDRIAQVDKHDENDARIVMRDVLSALAYIHQKGIMHRDMKPENLLLSADFKFVKLADFGFAKHVDGEQKGEICGTPEYVAPEMLKKMPYGVQVDMWSTGVILYILLSGCAPFQEMKRSVLFEKIKKAEYEFYEKQFMGISLDAKELVTALLTPDPSKRLTAEQALKHSWMVATEERLRSFSFSHDKMRDFRRFNARRKIMTAARVVIAMNRMRRMTNSMYTRPSSIAGSIVSDSPVANPIFQKKF